MDVLTLLRRENRPMMPAEIARTLGKTSAGVRSRLSRLAQAGLVARADGGYVALGDPLRGAEEREDIGASPLRQRCLDNARQRAEATVGNAFGQRQATVEGNVRQRPVYWAWEVWDFAFRAVLGELAGQVDGDAREELFAWAMLHLGLTPENHVLRPEAALILQTYALKQAAEVRRRLAPPRRRSGLAWLLGDDDAGPAPAQGEDKLQARFRRICLRMEEQAAKLLEQALK